MKYQFKNGDGVICENPSEANKLLVLALNNGYRAWSFTDTCNCFSVQTGIFCLCQESDIKRQISPSDFTALVQGKLPQYWCFDIREKDSGKALAYLNNKYVDNCSSESRWKGSLSGCLYYGYDGNTYFKSGTQNHAYVSSFQNSPFLLPVQYILDAADEEKRIEEEKRILDNNVKLFDAARPKYMDKLIKRFSIQFTELENSFNPLFRYEVYNMDDLLELVYEQVINVDEYLDAQKLFIGGTSFHKVWENLKNNRVKQNIKPKTMTKEQLKKHGALILAWANGEKIQFQSGLNSWHDVIGDPTWSLSEEYRVKPKPEYVPFDFTDASILRNKWVRRKDKNAVWFITSITDSGVSIGGCTYSYCDFLGMFEFLDGSPCGKLKP